MIKTVDPSSWGRISDPTSFLVKSAAGRLGPNDRAAFVKRAGHSFDRALHRVKKGEVPVHLIIIGSHEYFGINRNGDAFKEAVCKSHHDTFVKHAHFFRDHKNHADDLRYGRIIDSAYNDRLHRVELLAGLFETKEAARAADGDLGRVADKEMDLLGSNREIPVSMACRIANDICSGCHNKAANRSEYCDTKPVKLASGRVIPACTRFGCRHGLTKVADDGFIQYTDNPAPLTWFDCSHVGHQADRTAYVLGRAG